MVRGLTGTHLPAAAAAALLLQLLLVAPHARAGRNTKSTDSEYRYGGLEVTGEHLGVLPKNTGIDFSKPNQAYCDGCVTTVEQFHMQWLRYVTKESQEGDEVDQKDGGNAPPAITYNDEVEDMVTDICKSKIYRSYKHSDQITEVCQSMIGTEEVKRKIVAEFLAKDLNAKLLPGRKRNLCAEGGLVDACAKDTPYAFDVGGTSRCEICEAVVQDALYEVRKTKHIHGAYTKKSLFESLESLCMMGVLRHGEERVDAVYEFCEELTDEHETALVESMIRHLGDGPKVVQDICTDTVGACGSKSQKKGKKGKKGKKKKGKKSKKDL
eukprot:COSAG01_NODE_2963_length_6794_cov_3.981321_8_plen_325_part_00